MISASRASTGISDRSAASSSSVKPPGCFVVQLEAWTEPSVNSNGSAI